MRQETVRVDIKHRRRRNTNSAAIPNFVRASETRIPCHGPPQGNERKSDAPDEEESDSLRTEAISEKGQTEIIHSPGWGGEAIYIPQCSAHRMSPEFEERPLQFHVIESREL